LNLVRGVEITAGKNHVPVRLCIVCRKKKAKKELIRLVVEEDHNLTADIKGHKKGRGAYVCRNKFCREKLVLSKKLDHIFKTKIVSISQALRVEDMHQ